MIKISRPCSKTSTNLNNLVRNFLKSSVRPHKTNPRPREITLNTNKSTHSASKPLVDSILASQSYKQSSRDSRPPKRINRKTMIIPRGSVMTSETKSRALTMNCTLKRKKCSTSSAKTISSKMSRSWKRALVLPKVIL